MSEEVKQEVAKARRHGPKPARRLYVKVSLSII